MRFPQASVLLVLGALLVQPATASEKIYFKNRRVVEAASHEVKGALIYVTLTSGDVVVMRAADVDWEATGRLEEPHMVLRRTAYESLEEEEAAAAAAGKILTVADLKSSRGASRRRSVRQPRSETLAVFGAEAWTDTGIDLRRGQTINLRASGQVRIDADRSTGPDGRIGAGPARVSGVPVGALIGRIGSDGQPFGVGGSMSLTAPSSGRLYLGVNDTRPQDNGGSFEVSISQQLMPGGSSGGGSAAYPSSTSSSVGGSAPSGRKGMAGGVDRAEAARRAAEGR